MALLLLSGKLLLITFALFFGGVGAAVLSIGVVPRILT
jgi:hypothetical protein